MAASKQRRRRLGLLAVLAVFVVSTLTKTMEFYGQEALLSQSIYDYLPSFSDLPGPDDPSTFSACLMWMDENHRLPEWLAYHYHTVNLRYVVVAVDPYAKTSPSDVLDRWGSKMILIEWHDEDYRNETHYRGPNDSAQTKRARHRARQSAFFEACSRHLQENDRGWTLYIDVDEFMAYNPLHHNGTDLSQPGALIPLLTDVPDDVKCNIVPRTLITSVESTDDEIRAYVPLGLDPYRLDTLRWRYRGRPLPKGEGLAKSIMDVSSLNESDYVKGGTAHRPLRVPCPHVFREYDAPIGAHHYIGSWESYSSRDDARNGKLRNRAVWEERALLDEGGPDDVIRPWIRGFVNSVGLAQAKKLLAGNGFPRNATNEEEEVTNVEDEAATSE